jgi:hypothetical protein
MHEGLQKELDFTLTFIFIKSWQSHCVFICYDSSVDIAMDYELDERGSNPGRDTIFILSTTSRPVLGSTQPPIQ